MNVFLSPLTYHSVAEQKHYFLAQSSLSFMTWKSSNLCVCFPYVPTLFKINPRDSFIDISYLVLVDLGQDLGVHISWIFK